LGRALEEDESDLALIEASICGSKRPGDLVAALAQARGEADRHFAIGCIFKTMLDTVKNDKSKANRVALCLEIMVLNGYIPNIDAEEFCWMWMISPTWPKKQFTVMLKNSLQNL
jgi:hypothetical protein